MAKWGNILTKREKWLVALAVGLFLFGAATYGWLARQTRNRSVDQLPSGETVDWSAEQSQEFLYCRICGITKTKTKAYTISSRGIPVKTTEEFKETELSKWFERHFDGECHHYYWVRYGSWGKDFSGGWISGQGYLPFVVFLTGEGGVPGKADLDRLFQNSPRKCRLYIQQELRPPPEGERPIE